MFPSFTITTYSSPYLQRGGSQQRGEYTVICNLFATAAAAASRALSIAKFKLFRLLIVVVLLLLLLVGVANHHRFCSTRIARGTFPLAVVATTVFPLRFPTAVTSWGTYVFVATAATSATAIAFSTTPSVAIVRAVVAATIATDRVVLLRFCIESQA